MKIGYARVSTKDQNLDTQINELKLLGCEKIYFDKASGRSKEREEFKKLLEDIRESDTLIVTNLDRLSRNLKDLIFILELFSDKKVKVQIGTLSFDFTTAEGRLFGSFFGVIAQFERERIKERTMQGLLVAREQGRVGGKPPGLSEEAKQKGKEAYNLRIKGLKIREIMKLLEIKSSRSVYKYIRDYVSNKAVSNNLEIAQNGLEFINFTGDGVGVVDDRRPISYNVKTKKDGK